jgi:spore germination cell wall hydrolase CwlJ-like protein
VWFHNEKGVKKVRKPAIYGFLLTAILSNFLVVAIGADTTRYGMNKQVDSITKSKSLSQQESEIKVAKPFVSLSLDKKVFTSAMNPLPEHVELAKSVQPPVQTAELTAEQIPEPIEQKHATDSTTPNQAQTTERVSVSDSDKELLARLVTAEAGNQPYEGQVAVAAVVLNRALSGLFPESIKDIIYANNGRVYQFTPVKNGRINKDAIDSARQAVHDALSGSDPSIGALYFTNMNIERHKPNSNAKVTVIIGGHTFFK